MTITETFTGQICSSFPTDVRTVTYSTKKECEQVRQRINNTQRDVGGLGSSRCVAQITCSQCSGSDPVFPTQPNQSNNVPENINFNGPEQGKPFSPTVNPWQYNITGIDDGLLRLDSQHPQKNNETKVDKVYASLINDKFKDQNDSYRPESNSKKTTTPYVYIRKSSYEWMKDLAANRGLNFSNYFSEEAWNKDPREMTWEELMKSHHNYHRFIRDLYRGDKFAENALQMPKELMDVAIDKAAEEITKKAPYTGLLVSMFKNTAKELNSYLNGQEFNYKRLGANIFTDVEDQAINIVFSKAKGFSKEQVSQALSTIASNATGKFGEDIMKIPEAEKAITKVREKFSKKITDEIFDKARKEIKNEK